jgi:hypothetical protein
MKLFRETYGADEKLAPAAQCGHPGDLQGSSRPMPGIHGIAQGRCAMLREGPVMSNAATPSYLEIIDFIAAGTTPQAVVDYHPSAEARARVATLIAREKEGALAPDEKAELDHFMDLEHILRMAKARARQILTSGP